MPAPSFQELLDPAVHDRIMKSLHHQEGDRVPIWDLIDNRPTYEHFAPGETDPLVASVKVYHGLGIDLCRAYLWPFAAEDEGCVTDDDAGSEWRVSGQSQWRTKRPFRTVEDLAKFEPWEPNEAWLRDQDIPSHMAAREAFAPLTMYVPGGGCGFHAARDHVGFELFAVGLYDARADIERIVECFRNDAVARAKAYAEANLCPMYFIGDDVAYKNKLMFSPKMMRELFIPCLEACCRPLKEAGIQVIFHSDGDVTSLMDDMIEAGIDGINPIEPLAGMDIGHLKRRYGDRLVLVGNVDCSQTLPLGTPEDVREAVRECVRAVSPGGGHFIGSSSEVVPATPLENVLAFYEACREYGRYPIGV